MVTSYRELLVTDRKFYSKLPQPTGYRAYRPGSGLHNLHGPVTESTGLAYRQRNTGEVT